MRAKALRRATLRAAGCGLAVFLLALASIGLTRATGGVAFVWLPNALAFAVLVSSPRRDWHHFSTASFLGIAAANLVGGNSLLFSVGAGLANSVEFVLAAWLVSRYTKIASRKLALVAALKILSIYAAVAVAVSAVFGATLVWASKGVPWCTAYGNWFLGDLVGVFLLVLPLVMLLHSRMRYALNGKKGAVFWAAALLMVPATWFALLYTYFPFINITVLLSFIAFLLGGLRISVIANLTLAVMGALLWLKGFHLPPGLLTIEAHNLWMISALSVLFSTMVGIVADELREKNLLLTASEARFYDAMEFVASGFALADFSGHIVEMNGAFCRILGYTREELREFSTIDITLPEDRLVSLNYLRKLRAGEIDVYQLEKRFRHKDGQVVWADVKVSLLNSADGTRNIIVQIEDITQRHRHQQEILRLSERLTLATDAGGIGIWDLDLRTQKLIWDEQMFRIYDTDPSEGLNTYEMWRRCVHPDDIAPAEAILNQAIYEGKPFHAEFRIIDSKGQLKHIRAAATLIWDEKGQPLRMVGVNTDMTLLKNAELLHEKARDELQTIIDHIPALIGYWDATLHNRFGNQSYIDWFGKSPQEMQGRHIREVIGEQLYAQNLSHIQGALRGEPQYFERTVTDPAGHTRYSLTSYLPDMQGNTVKGFYVFVTDISQLKQAQFAVAEAQAHLQAVIDGASEFAIIATDTDGVIRLFNKGAEHMLGYTAEELVGKTTPDILHVPEEIIERRVWLSQKVGRTVDVAEVFIGRAKLGEADSGEWTLVHKQGWQIPARLVIAPMRNHQGEITGFVGIANDISAQRQARQVLRRAKEMAEQASQAKSDFVANMSHEIRTPMNAILGMSYLLGNTALTAEQRGHLDMIRVSAQGLLKILDEILDFSKIDAGKMQLAPVEFNLTELLQSLMGMLEIGAKQKALSFSLDVAPDVPEMLNGDAQRLRQILVNLTGNALKFTERGEVGLQVSVGCREGKHAVLRFVIRDTGIGMDSEHVARLFNPFEQADTSITRRFGGTGLGLAISRRLVEMMGGSIGVRSVLGEGSEFSFDIPFEVVAEIAPMSPSIPIPAESSTVHLNNAKLLLVEDNTINQEVARRVLTTAGASVDIAANGEHALARLRAGEHYDAILMDIQMPEMDGYSATRLIRNELKLDIPIIAMTAGVTQSEQDQCAAAGMDDFIAKPFEVQPMLAKIRRYLPEASGNTVSSSSSLPKGVSDSFNGTAFLAMLDGDISFCGSLIQQFIDNTRTNLDNVYKALNDNRHDEAMRILHTLKGTASTLHASRLAMAAAAAESCLRDERQPSLEHVELAFDDAQAAMMAWLATVPWMALPDHSTE